MGSVNDEFFGNLGRLRTDRLAFLAQRAEFL
jgi:hypothetical protein